MSAIQFLSSGGLASIGGDIPENERNPLNEIVKLFGEKVSKHARTLQVPASLLAIQQSNFLFIGRDVQNHYFIFATKPGETSINYRDLSSHGRLDIQSISHQIRIEVGDVQWGFALPRTIPQDALEKEVEQLVKQYVGAVLAAQRKPEKVISEESMTHPEIASGIEKFRQDHPASQQTAFIIMQFGTTKLHQDIVDCIKDQLSGHGITALRADDKEYLDDLFPNIKVYMHACDFGVAVFDRITEDDFNPNVTLEVGYMLGMGKDVLLLKDKTLKSLSTDLTGRLYKPFDTTDVTGTMPSQIEKWMNDKGLTKP